ncbi:MAG: hypothetical protein D6692_01750 [Planctomycetota bacterium]|nr:MAG: hypothetical protein D6692_01750 [Planctomycetota bacterium]
MSFGFNNAPLPWQLFSADQVRSGELLASGLQSGVAKLAENMKELARKREKKERAEQMAKAGAELLREAGVADETRLKDFQQAAKSLEPAEQMALLRELASAAEQRRNEARLRKLAEAQAAAMQSSSALQAMQAAAQMEERRRRLALDEKEARRKTPMDLTPPGTVIPPQAEGAPPLLVTQASRSHVAAQPLVTSNDAPAGPGEGPPMSADGKFYYDGKRWVPVREGAGLEDAMTASSRAELAKEIAATQERIAELRRKLKDGGEKAGPAWAINPAPNRREALQAEMDKLRILLEQYERLTGQSAGGAADPAAMLEAVRARLQQLRGAGEQ